MFFTRKSMEMVRPEDALPGVRSPCRRRRCISCRGSR